MFILVALKDRIRVVPNRFHISIEDAIARELNDRFANKVIINVGLCLTLFDILETKDSFIYQGDGAAHTVVNFRFVVFKPCIGEVIQGTLRSCSREGVSVSLGFFNDIIIPHQYLPEPKRFDEKEQLWVWEYETEDGKHDLFMEVGETIRFKVKEELFTDTLPAGPSSAPSNISAPSTSGTHETVEIAQRRIPYLIRGTINESGLGLNSWWNS